MENEKAALLTITSSFVFLFALVTTPLDLLAFAQIQSSPVPSQFQPPQQDLPSSPQQAISGEVVPAQRPDATPSSTGIETYGTIDSVINVSPSLAWVARGNYSLVDDGIRAYFVSLQKWTPTANTNATVMDHTHQFVNFRPIGPIVTLPNKDMQLKGFLDIGTNYNKWWKNVLTSIEIRGHAIAINPIGTDANSVKARNHFANTPIYGVADFITPCSSEPGPNMVVLPDCNFPAFNINNGMVPFYPLP